MHGLLLIAAPTIEPVRILQRFHSLVPAALHNVYFLAIALNSKN
jgi:hypothetical protein